MKFRVNCKLTKMREMSSEKMKTGQEVKGTNAI